MEALSAEELGIDAFAAPAPAKAEAKTSSNPFSGLFSGLASSLFVAEGLFHAHPQPGLAAGEISHHPDVSNTPSESSSTESGTGMHSHPHGYSEAPSHFGLPPSGEVSGYVHQGFDDTCAIQCQHLILNQFGIPVSENQLVREAIGEHIYNPGHGTDPANVGRLLEDHGLAVHRYSDANVINLAVELGQGHKVIVGVESGSLWHTNNILEEIWSYFGFGKADHAVIVSGINTQNWPHATVVVTDPGTGDVAREYPLDDFLAAWRGSHFSMVSTAEPAPPSLPEMAHFDYSAGHIPEIGSVPFEFAAQLALQASHESDPDVLSRMNDGFLSLVHGHATLDPYADPSHSHIDFSHAASDFASAAHHNPFDHVHDDHAHDAPGFDHHHGFDSGDHHFSTHHDDHSDADPDPFAGGFDDDHHT